MDWNNSNSLNLIKHLWTFTNHNAVLPMQQGLSSNSTYKTGGAAHSASADANTSLNVKILPQLSHSYFLYEETICIHSKLWHWLYIYIYILWMYDEYFQTGWSVIKWPTKKPLSRTHIEAIPQSLRNLCESVCLFSGGLMPSVIDEESSVQFLQG